MSRAPSLSICGVLVTGFMLRRGWRSMSEPVGLAARR